MGGHVLDREAAEALAAERFYCPPAAAELIVVAAGGERSELRFRAQAALRVLAAARDLELLEPDPAAPAWALAVGRACCELARYVALGLDRRGRERAARLLAELCAEAERVRMRRASEAVA